MDPHTAMHSLLRGAAKTLLLLVVIVLTAQGSTLPPSTQPRLERKDIDVLSIECRVPYHTAWMEGWEIPFAELQILYQGRYLNDKPEVVANLTSRNTKPATYGRFRNADIFTATSVQLPESGEGCDSCREIRVLMALSGPQYYGYYSCEAKSTGKNSRAIYTTLVDEQFVASSLTQVNGTLAVKSIRADEVNITWNDRLMQSSGSGEVSVERTFVDKEGQPLDNEASYILFRTVKDKPVQYENHGTLLVTKSGPDTTGLSKVRLVVKKDTLSSPLWRYSCQVSGNDCNRESKSHMATPEDSDCNCVSTGLVVGLSVGLGIVSFLLIIVVLVCCFVFWKLRRLRDNASMTDVRHQTSQGYSPIPVTDVRHQTSQGYSPIPVTDVRHQTSQGYSPIPVTDVRHQTSQGYSPIPVTDVRHQTSQGYSPIPVTDVRHQTSQGYSPIPVTDVRHQTPQGNSTLPVTDDRQQTPQGNSTLPVTDDRQQTPQGNSTLPVTDDRQQTPQGNSTLPVTDDRQQTPQGNSTLPVTDDRQQTPQGNSTLPVTDDRQQTPQGNSTLPVTDDRQQTPQGNSTLPVTDDRQQTPQGNSTVPMTDDRQQTSQGNSTLPVTDDRQQTPQGNSTLPVTDDRQQTPQGNSTLPVTDDRQQTPQGNSTENTGGMHATTGIIPLRADRTPAGTGEEIHDDNNIHNVNELGVSVADQTTQSDDNDVSTDETTYTRDQRPKRRRTTDY
ncbi:uncharacterized protein [Littorina saxatilis]|uniref:uncharacterized protein n=1 Tax=Littorina saxatilis TaxID=31220 RepID=UPI0038B5981B